MLISTIYELAGSLHGMPVIQETGLCTDDSADINQLTRFDPGRLELVAVPRLTGIVAKSLDGKAIRTDTLQTPFGKFVECLQYENTQFREYAPKQPFGQFLGKRILAYRRVWVQLTS